MIPHILHRSGLALIDKAPEKPKAAPSPFGRWPLCIFRRWKFKRDAAKRLQERLALSMEHSLRMLHENVAKLTLAVNNAGQRVASANARALTRLTQAERNMAVFQDVLNAQADAIEKR